MGKIGWLTRLWSYVKEIHVESAPNQLHPHLYVSISKGRYMLSTANAVYSHADLYDNFGKVFSQIAWHSFHPERSLILGLGLASIPILLEKQGVNTSYTAIEIDADIINLATRYSLPDISSPIQIFEADALSFMAQNKETFDLVCMDVFVDDMIPEAFRAQDFIDHLKAALSPRGLLIVNTLRDRMPEKESHRHFVAALGESFPDSTVLNVGPNRMFVHPIHYLQSD